MWFAILVTLCGGSSQSFLSPRNSVADHEERRKCAVHAQDIQNRSVHSAGPSSNVSAIAFAPNLDRSAMGRAGPTYATLASSLCRQRTRSQHRESASPAFELADSPEGSALRQSLVLSRVRPSHTAEPIKLNQVAAKRVRLTPAVA